MRIPDRIVGFVSLNEKRMPFELEKENLKLKLYHPTEGDAYKEVLSGLKIWVNDEKERKWIDNIVIEGKTAEGYHIYFGTANNPQVYHGYRTYSISWYYVTGSELKYIDEIRFYGREIDYFFSPNRALKETVKYKKEDSTIVDSMKVESVHVEKYNGGHYCTGEIQIDVSCSAYAEIKFQSNRPLNAKSFMRLEFSKPVDLEQLVKQINNVIHFFNYICYRKNCYFTEIEAYLTNEDGKKLNCGIFVFKNLENEEWNSYADERIIKAEYLQTRMADIIHLIDKGELSFGHFCESIEDLSSYSVSRMIMILAAFEREFRNSYGQDVKRSDDYKVLKGEVINLIENYANGLRGKRKKYANGFAKGIANSDSSFGENVKFAMTDCKSIIQRFIQKRYNDSYEDVIEAIGERINLLRNGIAHCRLDLEVDAKHLDDIVIIEELLYVMRLKKLGIEDDIVQKAINELFREGLSL